MDRGEVVFYSLCPLARMRSLEVIVLHVNCRYVVVCFELCHFMFFIISFCLIQGGLVTDADVFK